MTTKILQLQTKSGFVIDPLVVGVGLPDMNGFYLLSCPDMLVVDLLHHLDQHVTLAVTWEVEMPPSGLHISVNISKVLGKPLLQALTCLSYVLYL